MFAYKLHGVHWKRRAERGKWVCGISSNEFLRQIKTFQKRVTLAIAELIEDTDINGTKVESNEVQQQSAGVMIADLVEQIWQMKCDFGLSTKHKHQLV